MTNSSISAYYQCWIDQLRESDSINSKSKEKEHFSGFFLFASSVAINDK